MTLAEEIVHYSTTALHLAVQMLEHTGSDRVAYWYERGRTGCLRILFNLWSVAAQRHAKRKKRRAP